MLVSPFIMSSIFSIYSIVDFIMTETLIDNATKNGMKKKMGRGKNNYLIDSLLHPKVLFLQKVHGSPKERIGGRHHEKESN